MDTRGLRGAVLRWAAALAQLVRHSLAASDPATLESERLALARLALRAGRALKPSAGSAERADLLLLALSNVRAAVVCLHAARRTTSTSERAIEAAPSEPLEPNLTAIVERSIEVDISAGPSQARRDLELLLAHGQRLLFELEEPARRARIARRRDWIRTLAALLGLAVVVGFAGWRLSRARDLAAGKPWTTSSVGLVCDPAHKQCGGARTSILFHTLEDAEPWFEIDLGAVHELTRVEVQNRTDCCQERAVPLIIEVSLDHQHYRTVAHKFTSFEHWSQGFPATPGRYVRLRVTRRSVLHLDQVQVYGRRLD